MVFDKLQVKVCIVFRCFFYGASMSVEDCAFFHRGCHALHKCDKKELVEGLDDRAHTRTMENFFTNKFESFQESERRGIYTRGTEHINPSYPPKSIAPNKSLFILFIFYFFKKIFLPLYNLQHLHLIGKMQK